MPAVVLAKGGFEETVTGSEILLIGFRAARCGPCRMFGPVYAKAAERRPDLVSGGRPTPRRSPNSPPPSGCPPPPP
ncbi:thioredoxin domain-containing protein [Streptomyces antibioticus]|uniref:thioredoxin domain-containing protein n=1 Tax=Streptomyces antibioticus TaxID=1890 RepID=UPI00369F26DA